MVRITGDQLVKRRLSRMAQPVVKAVYGELVKGGAKIRREAVVSIQSHRSQGRVYRRGRRMHIASLPGYPPNSDTGQLAGSIHETADLRTLTVTVGTPLEKGQALEYGSKRVAARPFLRPALRKFYLAILQSTRAAVRRTIGR